MSVLLSWKNNTHIHVRIVLDIELEGLNRV